MIYDIFKLLRRERKLAANFYALGAMLLALSAACALDAIELLTPREVHISILHPDVKALDTARLNS
jgi:hypothetical protein